MQVQHEAPSDMQCAEQFKNLDAAEEVHEALLQVLNPA
jgi:hypothetical protein